MTDFLDPQAWRPDGSPVTYKDDDDKAAWRGCDRVGDMTTRHACGLYVDLRLGIIGAKILNPEEARIAVARAYGHEAAAYAREVCG